MLLLWLFSCRVDLAAVGTPMATTSPEAHPATPPPAPGPAGEKLYQLLYAGEIGVSGSLAYFLGGSAGKQGVGAAVR